MYRVWIRDAFAGGCSPAAAWHLLLPCTHCWRLSEISLEPHSIPFHWLWETAFCIRILPSLEDAVNEVQMCCANFTLCWPSLINSHKSRCSLGNSPEVVSFLAGGPGGLKRLERGPEVSIGGLCTPGRGGEAALHWSMSQSQASLTLPVSSSFLSFCFCLHLCPGKSLQKKVNREPKSWMWCLLRPVQRLDTMWNR